MFIYIIYKKREENNIESPRNKYFISFREILSWELTLIAGQYAIGSGEVQ